MKRGVVITGIGAVTPLGSNIKECWENILNKKTGIRETPSNNTPRPFRYRGIVESFHIPQDIPRKISSQMKFLNRASYLGFSAALEAVETSGIDLQEVEIGRRSLYIGSGDFTMVGYEFMHDAIDDALDKSTGSIDQARLNRASLTKVNPFFLLESLANNAFSFLSSYFQLMGPGTSLASLSPSGSVALELAVRSIRQDYSDMALVVGSGNWITDIPMYELEGLGVLSRCKNGVSSYRPLDRERDGFIPGEGAGAIVLEAEERAKNRGAHIFGRILGTGNSIEFQPGGGFSVSPTVTKRAMEEAISEANITPDDISFISTHGSGTRKGDEAELGSISDLLGKETSVIPVSAFKGYTGHLGAASDIAEVIFSLLSLKDNLAPATLNFHRADQEFAHMSISGEHRSIEAKRFLSVSYGIGGEASAVVVEKL